MATNFLEAAGSYSGGFIQSVTIVGWSTTLSALANGSSAISTSIFSSGSFGGAIKLQGYIVNGTAAFTATAGGNLSFWWLLSTDGGTTFENVAATINATNAPLARPPDFVIPFETNIIGTSVIKWMTGPFFYPYVTCKTVIQNNSGAALGAGGAVNIVIGGVADQY